MGVAGGWPAYRPPCPIEPGHRLETFACGKPALDDWLRAHALNNEGRASRTFVVLTEASEVAAYYTLAVGSVILSHIPRKYRHDLPGTVPVMVLGRLAVDEAHRGRGLGSAMLHEALIRTLRIAGEAGVRAMIVHAIDDEAVSFYARYGFTEFPPETHTMFLPVETMTQAIEG